MEEKIAIFKNYCNQYDMNDPMIKLKYNHSLRVMDLCRLITSNLKLNDDDVRIMEIIGLLHDYARFEQWTKYNTFNDLESIDHADLAVEKLFKNKEIDKFKIDENYYKYLKTAIKHHNKFNIPSSLTKKERIFCQIIRDADKLDILENCISINKNENYVFSNEVEELFNNKKEINVKTIKTKGDKILLHLALIYDLNYKQSFEYLYNNKILEKLYYKKLDKYFIILKNYVEERIK